MHAPGPRRSRWFPGAAFVLLAALSTASMWRWPIAPGLGWPWRWPGAMSARNICAGTKRTPSPSCPA